MSSPPNSLGVHDGKLAPCPSSANCVSTQAEDEAHRMEPWKFTGTVSEAIQRLKSILAQQPRMRIVSETDNYLHAEATSLIFRFVDDIEFYLDEANGVIQFRSASRVGYSDLGVNRSRMERLKAAWNRGNSP